MGWSGEDKLLSLVKHPAGLWPTPPQVVYSGVRELQEVQEATLHRVGWKRAPLPASCQLRCNLQS